MKKRLYRVLAMVLSLMTAALSLADGGMFAWMVLEGGNWPYLLFALSLVGAAVLLLVAVLWSRTGNRPTVLSLLWLFVNACVFLLLPTQEYGATVAVAAPVDGLFKVVPYFFLMVLTVVSVTQTLGHEE